MILLNPIQLNASKVVAGVGVEKNVWELRRRPSVSGRSGISGAEMDEGRN